jgi:general secretion pathway protein M
MTIIARLRETYAAMEPEMRLRIGIAMAVLLALPILYSALNDQTARLKKKLAGREAAVRELLVLKQRYLEANAGAQRLANRLSAVKPDDSPARLLEEIGIKGKGSQVRPLKGEERAGAVEDAAEVKIEGLTANEAVNLLHRLEQGPRPVFIRKTSIRSRFDDPARLDLTMSLVLLKPAPQGAR